MYQFLCIFFIYAFLGWCTEVSYAALQTGKFVNRGFLNGPVCPIYGFGVVIIIACLTPLKKNLLLLFLGSVVLTSLLELATKAVPPAVVGLLQRPIQPGGLYLPEVLHRLGLCLPVCRGYPAPYGGAAHRTDAAHGGLGAAGDSGRIHGGGPGRHGEHHC